MKKFGLLVASALVASSLMAAAPVSSPSANKFGLTMGSNVGGGIVYDTPKYQYTLTTGVWSTNVSSSVDTYDIRASASMKTPMTSSIDQLWTVQGYAQTSTNYKRAFGATGSMPYNVSLQYGFQQAISKKLSSYIRLPIIGYNGNSNRSDTITLLDENATVIGISMYR